MVRRASLLTLLCLQCFVIADDSKSTPNVFDLPRIQTRYSLLQRNLVVLFQKRKYEDAEKLCRQMIQLAPYEATPQYNLACALARQQKVEPAFDALHKSIELGFRDVQKMRTDSDLESLRSDKRFEETLNSASRAEKAKPNPWFVKKIQPARASNGQVLVTEENTAWDPRFGVFKSYFQQDVAAAEKTEIIKGNGPLGILLNKWYREGTAAGNRGDFYDNHDRDHSNLKFQEFPQLTRIEFGPEPKRRNFDNGLQRLFLYNTVTIGNSSTALTKGPMWRSQPRAALTNSLAARLLYLQYISNHLYVYPEHKDHDPGGSDKTGYGDTYPANTPYIIISQGSSYTDKPFLDAIAATLAAFRPNVKQFLTKNRALMPTIQMLFRLNNRDVLRQADLYLTGDAHPTAFNGKDLDPIAMAKIAHSMKRSEVPPLVQLKVIEEDLGHPGIDYFDIGPREKLFDTPCAIARIVRSMKYERRMVVTAEGSRDLNGRPLTFHWSVLRGDSERIKIRPLNKNRSRVELIIPYHKRKPIAPTATLESHRVDIGAFVHNGRYYSAPAFVSFSWLDNEKRVYDSRTKQIQSVEYVDNQAVGTYIDPLLSAARKWKDVYHYDEQNQLIGWTRHREKSKQRYTTDGAVVSESDEMGRAIKARSVLYLPRPRHDGTIALEERPGPLELEYSYDSADDQRGTISKRIPVKSTSRD